MTGFGISLIGFIIAISVLVAVHEFGHFWVARRLGVKVLRFSVGFGKTLWSRRGKDGTQYQVAVFPLGGYVKMRRRPAVGKTGLDPLTDRYHEQFVSTFRHPR
mgnify:CR=1 FL=1